MSFAQDYVINLTVNVDLVDQTPYKYTFTYDLLIVSSTT